MLPSLKKERRSDGPCNADDLENITLSGRSPTQKVALCLILLKRNIQNRSLHTHRMQVDGAAVKQKGGKARFMRIGFYFGVRGAFWN